ncbi:hypothetical protein AWI37_10050 [Klebsiella aerogenes]|nr:hypothetical protein AWI08_24725 [Klebsiella aerogenes]KUR29227.1 hypothetical protein AWI37_10050 [Klebsiella aerogenes]
MLNQQPGAVVSAPAQAVEAPAITLISASQTGNARRVAEALRDDLQAAQLNVKLVNAGDYKFKQIAGEKLLVVVTSTQGDGRRFYRLSGRAYHGAGLLIQHAPEVAGHPSQLGWRKVSRGRL